MTGVGLGAPYRGAGPCRFPVRAPLEGQVEVRTRFPGEALLPLPKEVRDYFPAVVAGVEPGCLQVYRLNGQQEALSLPRLPDIPAPAYPPGQITSWLQPTVGVPGVIRPRYLPGPGEKERRRRYFL